MSYQNINASIIDKWIKEEDWEWGKAISHEEYIKALNGNWNVKLTPVKFVPHEWFGDLKGKKIIRVCFWWRTTNSCIHCLRCRVYCA